MQFFNLQKDFILTVISVLLYSSVINGASTANNSLQGNNLKNMISEKSSSDTVELHRYFNTENGDHFYTTNWEEIGNGKWSYIYEGVAARVFSSPRTGTVPLHRYYNGENNDHFYTTNWAELIGGKDGYKYEGIACYVFDHPVNNSLPLYRYYKPSDHFYTTNWNELQDGRGSYTLENIQAYVSPK